MPYGVKISSIDISDAVKKLKEHGIEAFEGKGILVIPCSTPEEIFDLANDVRRIFKEVGYNKSWQINPYYYDKKQSLTDIMYNQEGDLNSESNEE